MLFFPNAKINIGLNVINKRADGYHNIETIFCPVGLKDVLEFVPDDNLGSGTMEFRETGLAIDSPFENNLCVKAYKLLCNDFKLPGIQAQIHKVIPMGAGLGGGSSDAAFMLKYLNDCFELRLTAEDLCNYAAVLGSDCGFFIENRPLFACERGNKFTEISFNPGYFEILLVYPAIHISTADAYAGVIPQMPLRSLVELINLPVEEWKGNIINDFEAGIFKKHPGVRAIKDKLYETGAVYASMSGSGSSVYGIYYKAPDPEEIFGDYFCWSGPLIQAPAD